MDKPPVGLSLLPNFRLATQAQYQSLAMKQGKQ